MIPKQIRLLMEYDELYYGDGKSPISDTEYDRLKDDARRNYPDHEYFKEIGAMPTTGKIKLPYIIGSLNKRNLDNIKDWLDGVNDDYVASEKLDGVSIYAEYINGKVVFAAKKGKSKAGESIGQIITDKAKIFCPMIEYKQPLKVRGEVMLIEDSYLMLGYKNRRNGAAGILNADGIENCEHLQVFFHEIIEPNNLLSEYERLNFLDQLGFNTPVWTVIKKKTVDIVYILMDFLRKSKEQTMYDIDGVVVTKNVSKRENVVYPKDKIAFKVNEDAVTTVVTEILWNTGRTGDVVPVICVEPISIGGVMISRTSGFNGKFIKDNEIGVGSKIGLVRSGDVIPFITEVYESTGAELPSVCPSCGNRIDFDELGTRLVCKNPLCDSQVIKKIAHFFRTLGAEGIDEKTVENIGVKSIEEMYELDELEIAGITGFGERSGQLIAGEIRKTLTCKPEQLLAAFGIKNIGIELAKVITTSYKFEDLFNLREEEFFMIDGIGGKRARNIVTELREYKPLYEFMLRFGLKIKQMQTQNNQSFKFCITGTHEMKRDDMIRLLESKGHIFKKSVTKTGLDYLVTAESEKATTKYKNAVKYGIKIIGFEEFINFMDDDSVGLGRLG